MNRTRITEAAYLRALTLRDLTDAAHGAHAMQQLVSDVVSALQREWGCELLVHRGSPVVGEEENYDLLGYSRAAAARDGRYTRYLADGRLLRTHMSAAVPGALALVTAAHADDLLISCPGLVYRRDVIDRLHVGEPHQLDLWRIARAQLREDSLAEMIETVLAALLPGRRYRTSGTSHPYTLDGLEVEAEIDGSWVEVLECGYADPAVLRRCGLDPSSADGLAMGVGLDRMLMLRKGIDDIRLLRSSDERIARQMLDLEPYRPVSSLPAVKRDISIAVGVDVDAELLGERLRDALDGAEEALEEVEILAETSVEELPPHAADRLGIKAGQKNLLVRLVIRHPSRSLTDQEANELRDRAYAAVHEGDAWQWAALARTTGARGRA